MDEIEKRRIVMMKLFHGISGVSCNIGVHSQWISSDKEDIPPPAYFRHNHTPTRVCVCWCSLCNIMRHRNGVTKCVHVDPSQHGRLYRNCVTTPLWGSKFPILLRRLTGPTCDIRRVAKENMAVKLRGGLRWV